MQLHGREIFLREDREDFELTGASGKGGTRGPPPSRGRGQDVAVVGRQLYVSNLSSETTWQTLKDYFKSCGPVLHADIFTVSQIHDESQRQHLAWWPADEDPQPCFKHYCNFTAPVLHTDISTVYVTALNDDVAVTAGCLCIMTGLYMKHFKVLVLCTYTT